MSEIQPPFDFQDICNERWRAPRHDAPLSVPVEHVCGRERDHGGYCICACGAKDNL